VTEKRINIIVSGLVQGVGFRMFVLREAHARRLSGWTRNRPDGTVEIEAQGNSGVVDELARQAQIGPSRSRVTSIKVREKAIDASDREFRILT
jgi:acylphosphatase